METYKTIAVKYAERINSIHKQWLRGLLTSTEEEDLKNEETAKFTAAINYLSEIGL